MQTPNSLLVQMVNPLSFESYMEQWRTKNALTMKGLDKIQRRTRFYSKYNLERHERVLAEWRPSEAFETAVSNLPGPLLFVFITDDWCVDSAYSLPLLQWVANRRPDMHLSIGLKDENLVILDQFLTDGARSIPKLIILNEASEVLSVWGPQPEEIRLIRKKLMDQQAEGSVVSGTTVEWYAEFGTQAVEKELVQLFVAL